MIRLLCWLPMAALLGCGPQAQPAGQRITHPSVALFALLDEDGSGLLSVDELHCTQPQDLLERLDTNKDRLISLDELRSDLEGWPEDLSRHASHGARHQQDKPKAGPLPPKPPKPGGPPPSPERPPGKGR